MNVDNSVALHNVSQVKGLIKGGEIFRTPGVVVQHGKMMQLASQHHSEVPPLTSNIHPTNITAAKSETPKSLQWTGNTLDLVELIYGLSEMGCIDNGETPLKVLAPALYEFFGLDTKECYRCYSAIKLRKNPSRTYFIDKMQKKLNEKIRRDEELERMRR